MLGVVRAADGAETIIDGPILATSPIATSRQILPDLLPPDLLVLLVEHLVAADSLQTLASLQQTSKSNYDLVTPFLHQRRRINTGSFTLDKILSTDTSAPIEDLEKRARRGGKLWLEAGAPIRNRIHMQFVEEVIVDSLPPDAVNQPKKRIIVSSTTPVPNVRTVTITPEVLHDLSLFFSAHISENFLRPLATACTPAHLVLRHPDDTALGSYKHLMNLVDELRWPQLRKLTLHNIGAHALPSRPGLQVVVHFAEGVPIKWNAGDLPTERRLRKYERSRATQLLMAIPRSAWAKDGVEGLGDMRWTFVHAGRFFGDKHAQESTENLREAVRLWAQREYIGAGWDKTGVDELLSRIEFVA